MRKWSVRAWQLAIMGMLLGQQCPQQNLTALGLRACWRGSESQLLARKSRSIRGAFDDQKHFPELPHIRPPSTMESTMEQRRQEILAKKAKLAELKRQRELRRQESSSRQSLNASPLGEVRRATRCAYPKQVLTSCSGLVTNTAARRGPGPVS